MANKKTKLGAIITRVKGLHIRQMLDHKGNPNGQFGIYAGKKLYTSYFSVKESISVAEKCQSNKPSHHPYVKAFQTWKQKN